MYESLAAAIQAGADSIYFGIESLNMRARSANSDVFCNSDKYSFCFTMLQMPESPSAAEKTLREARDERDAVKNVISGYTLRLDGRKKKAEQARERHVRLKMDENALTARIRMLTEMEKLHEGYSKAVKLVMGEVQRVVS